MASIYGRYLNPTPARMEELTKLRFRLRQRCFDYEGAAEAKYFRLMERSNQRMRNEWEARHQQQVNRMLSSCGY